MDVVASSPFTTATLLWMSRAGRMHATVIVKAGFRLEPVECELLGRPEPIATTDHYEGNDRTRALRFPSDLVPFKPAADVVLVGSAHAGPEPVRTLVARVVVGDVDKAIEVHTDRVVHPDGTTHEGAAFAKIPLTWELAAGGPDTGNPIGMRLDATDGLGRLRLPQLQPPGMFLNPKTPIIPPISFGAIPASWPSRSKHLKDGVEPLPADYATAPIAEALDRTFFNVTPPDQRTAFLRPYERIILERLSPKHARLVTALPNVRPRAIFEGSQREIELHADTLVIDTDRQVCAVTWRGITELPSFGAPSRVRIVGERDDAPLATAFAQEPTRDDAEPAGRSVPPLAVAKEEGTDILPALAPGKVGPDWLKGRARGSDAPAPRPVLAPPILPSPIVAPPMVPAPAPPAFTPPAREPAPGPVAQVPSYVHTTGPASLGGAPIPPPYVPAFRSEPPPAIPGPSHAVAFGAEASSNAAAAARPVVDEEPSTASDASREPEPPKVPLELLYFDPRVVPRVRRRFKEVVDDLDFEDLGPEHALASGDPDADKAQSHVFGVLSNVPASRARDLRAVAETGLHKSGRYTPPLAVLEGELQWSFSDVAKLQMAKRLLEPLFAADKRLADLCADRPASERGASQSFQSIREHHAATYGKGPHALDLAKEVERRLLDDRAFEERVVLGESFYRARLGKDEAAATVYMPHGAKDHVPLFESFEARILAEVHPRQERLEPAPFALRVLAIARIFSLELLRR